MKQHVTTDHQLETRDPRNSIWHCTQAGMFNEANRLAYIGRLHEALAHAVDTQIENYGAMHDVEFRIVTTTRTVTVLGNIDGKYE